MDEIGGLAALAEEPVPALLRLAAIDRSLGEAEASAIAECGRLDVRSVDGWESRYAVGMKPRQPRRESSDSTGETSSTPARRRRAADLLRTMSALDRLEDHPMADAARERLREQAAAMGLRLVSFTVTEEPIPDPAIEALPKGDLDRLAAISRDMYQRPQRHVAELEMLVKKHPHIPMLRNHLAGALEAAGERERATALIAQTAREFPRYIFAFCNHVMALLADGKVDEARALVETGQRGPLFVLTDFDPSRDTFHVSEAASHAAMVGRYMLATGRLEAAKVQLRALKQTMPKSAQTQSLTAAIERYEMMSRVAAVARQLQAEAERRAQPGRTAADKKRKPTAAAEPRDRPGKRPSQQ